jgi:hypothetical protein
MDKLLVILIASVFSLSTFASERFEVSINVPDLCTNIIISDIYASRESAFIVAHVIHSDPGTMCAMAIGRATSTVFLDRSKPKNTQRIIVGKDWCWKRPSENEGYLYPKSEKEFLSIVQNKERLFSQSLPKSLNFKGFEADKNCKP